MTTVEERASPEGGATGADPYRERPWLASYPQGVARDVDPRSYSTLVAMFRDSVARHGERTALSSFGGMLTYAELARAADAVASWLQAQGLAKGDRVAIMSPNVMAYPAILYGVLIAGGVVVNVNPLYTPHELTHQLNDSDARFIFVLENFAHTVEAALADTALERVVVIAPGDLLGLRGTLVNIVSRYAKRAVKAFSIYDSVELASVLRDGRRRAPQPVEVTRDDVAFLQYTGGTTGVAKGAILLHSNVAANVAQSSQFLAPFLPRPQDMIMVTALPLYHIFGLTACCLLMTHFGATALLIANPRDLKSFVKTLRKERFTAMSGVNTLYAALLEQSDLAEVDFSQLEFCISGGMATQDVVARRWKQLTGKPICEGYGLSETSPIITMNRPDITDFSGTIGVPCPSTEVSIRNDGAVAPLGERGELCVKGPQVTPGYWKRPDETARCMTPDGFFRTGDVALMTPSGEIKIVDRLKEMIIVSGFNVYPNEVENVLAQHPLVKDVAVIGVPDPHSGEAPLAFIVPRGEGLTTDELRAFAHKELTGYKIPRRFEFRAELPKSTVGKILRRALREEYLKEGATRKPS